MGSICDTLHNTYINLYERGYIELEDVRAILEWINVIKSIDNRYCV